MPGSLGISGYSTAVSYPDAARCYWAPSAAQRYCSKRNRSTPTLAHSEAALAPDPAQSSQSLINLRFRHRGKAQHQPGALIVRRAAVGQPVTAKRADLHTTPLGGADQHTLASEAVDPYAQMQTRLHHRQRRAAGYIRRPARQQRIAPAAGRHTHAADMPLKVPGGDKFGHHRLGADFRMAHIQATATGEGFGQTRRQS